MGRENPRCAPAGECDCAVAWMFPLAGILSCGQYAPEAMCAVWSQFISCSQIAPSTFASRPYRPCKEGTSMDRWVQGSEIHRSGTRNRVCAFLPHGDNIRPPFCSALLARPAASSPAACWRIHRPSKRPCEERYLCRPVAIFHRCTSSMRGSLPVSAVFARFLAHSVSSTSAVWKPPVRAPRKGQKLYRAMSLWVHAALRSKWATVVHNAASLITVPMPDIWPTQSLRLATSASDFQLNRCADLRPHQHLPHRLDARRWVATGGV